MVKPSNLRDGDATVRYVGKVLFCTIPSFRFLFVERIGHAVDTLSSHLRIHHPRFSLDERKAIINENAKYAIDKLSEAKLPPGLLAALPVAARLRSGNRRGFVCQSIDHTRQHAN